MSLIRRYIVHGRVQGVGYRYFVERVASGLNVAGWVRNNEDSTVEVLAMGTAEQLADLKQQLLKGPRASRVDGVDEGEATPEQTQQEQFSHNRFEIKGAW